MEVFSGFLAHTDAQVNRLFETLDRMGQFDNTLVIYLTGDNGASAEGTYMVLGVLLLSRRIHEDPEWLLEHMDDFGSDRCENHFNVGTGEFALSVDEAGSISFGGTVMPLLFLGLKASIGKDNLRSQFHHVIDVLPTV